MALLERRSKTGQQNVYDRLIRYAEFLGFGEVHMKIDEPTGLRAIVAIHSTKLGPAIGGCRHIPYETTDQALTDVLRLGQMMSYKAAAANLAHGGAKSVLIKPKVIEDRTAYFKAFGKFVNELGGRYITAVDVGTSTADMDIIATTTDYVTCTSDKNHGDPSPITAHGVLRGMQAAVKHLLKTDSFDGLHIAVQGLGHVGFALAEELHQLGAKLTVCDPKAETTQKAAAAFGATVVDLDEIYHIECDVFAPCALGAILNLANIKKLNCKIVAGAANNQLAHKHHAVALHNRGILYAPDFVINAAGLIHVSALYDHADINKADQQVEHIYDTTMEIFKRAELENRATNDVALIIAEENLGKR